MSAPRSDEPVYADRLPLRPTRSAPALARAFCEQRISTWCPDAAHTLPDVRLVTSELVTNAYRARARTIEVHIACTHDAVLIAVADDAPGHVLPRDAEDDAESGRGLGIVEYLALEWGVTLLSPTGPGDPQPQDPQRSAEVARARRPAPHKEVWARLGRHG